MTLNLTNWQTLALTGQSQDHLIDFEAHLIHPAMEKALLALRQAAADAGFDLAIASAFRSFERQSLIWNNKFNGISPILDDTNTSINPNQFHSDKDKIKAILRWSALPGASRHHWGSELDIYAKNLLSANTALKLEPWEYLTGHQRPFYLWLAANLEQFGFYFPYDKDRGGIGIEPWHISYRAISEKALDKLTPNLLAKRLQQEEIAGKKTVLLHLDELFDTFITNVNKGTS